MSLFKEEFDSLESPSIRVCVCDCVRESVRVIERGTEQYTPTLLTMVSFHELILCLVYLTQPVNIGVLVPATPQRVLIRDLLVRHQIPNMQFFF